MDKTLELLDKYLQGAVEVISKYAPKAWEALCTIKYITSLYNLLSGVLLVVFSILLIFAGKYAYNKYSEDSYDSKEEWVPVFVLCWAMAFITIVGCFVNLLDLDNWLGLFRPDLAIIKDAMDAMKHSK